MAKSRKETALGFLRNLPDDDETWATVESLVDGINLPATENAKSPRMGKLTEPMWVSNKFNPAYLVEQRDIYLRFARDWQVYYGHLWPRLKECMGLCREMGKEHGIDLSSYAPEVLSLKDIEKVDDIFSATSAQCEEIKQRILNSNEVGLTLLDDAKKKRWAKTLQQVQELQDWCRNRRPKKKKLSKRMAEVWRYLHPIRYMLYTTRSELMSETGELMILDTPPHLLMACMIMKIAEAHAGSNDIDGALIIIPPRHGKTLLLMSDTALDINENPHLNNAIIHNSSKLAVLRYKLVKDHFLIETDVGKRRAALFPEITIDPRIDNDEKFFVLVNGKRKNINQEGNLSPWGVHSKGTGVTFHKIKFDDPSDEKEQSESGTRERTNKAIINTWLRRLTGKFAFFTEICTRWHPDDFAGKLIDLIKSGDKNMAYYSLVCGGPDEDFEPIWPEAGYDSKYLASAYASMTASDYACIFRNDPDTEESRRISRLYFYDYEQWLNPQNRNAKWERFLNSPETTFYQSTDPSGTAHATSNLAGVTLSAFGMLEIKQPDGTWKEQPKLVFLEFWSLPASQHKIAKIISTTYHDLKIKFPNTPQRIIVETTGGYHATADELTLTWKIPKEEVIRRSPGIGTKIARLMKYAAFIEAADILFPGKFIIDERSERVLRLDSNWQEVSSQILRAGTTKEFNMGDCIRQQLAEVSHHLYKLKGEKDPESITAKKINKRRDFIESVIRRISRRKSHSKPRNHKFPIMRV